MSDQESVARQWQVEPGEDVDLYAIDPRSSAGAPGDKRETKKLMKDLRPRLAELQERLFAESRQSLLLVLQAMDAGGKDSAIKKVFRGINPQGCKVHSFRAPSELEKSHDFLWRVHRLAPPHGEIGIFNRSHYEDVVAVRVRDIAPEEVWRPRFDVIRDFERGLHISGTKIVKVFLHISAEEQAKRFRRRLARSDKHWKFSKDDLADRRLWDDYMKAYGEAIELTTTEECPWYVIPGDRKWYRAWVLMSLLISTLEEMDPQWPDPEAGLDKITIE